ncbi:DNA-binding IscR family transcriptional regulator [Deinococcus humi]|uniref:DNA-binding IscR family transcriptional regulator n=2 Tax=Deinococcus humi TaxID=662880 RepID=A0A7W8JXY5_9DEIO|nr:DNA-binding IscR family transcriptional regulator [Deinococcus humi]
MIALNPQRSFSSEDLASSVGTHAVVIRSIVKLLRGAGLVQTQQGVAGIDLTRRPEELTLLQIYRAVDAPESVFRVHEQPNPQCSVGSNILDTLGSVFGGAQEVLDAYLANVTLADVMSDLARRIG